MTRLEALDYLKTPEFLAENARRGELILSRDRTPAEARELEDLQEWSGVVFVAHPLPPCRPAEAAFLRSYADGSSAEARAELHAASLAEGAELLAAREATKARGLAFLRTAFDLVRAARLDASGPEGMARAEAVREALPAFHSACSDGQREILRRIAVLLEEGAGDV